MNLPVSPFDAAAALIALWQAVQVGACVTAMRRARARVQNELDAPSPDAPPERVTLIRPCCGAEGDLAERLAHTAGATHVIFAVASSEDGAYPAAREAAERLVTQGVHATCVLTAPEGPNLKVDQLARALRTSETRDVVLVVDSDVDLLGFPALRLAGSVIEGPIGAAYAPASETASKTFGDRANLAVLTGSLHAFSMLAGIDPEGFVGKVFAVRREALDRAGGFERLRTVLGEDVELGARVRRLGLETRAFGQVAHAVGSGRSWNDTVARFARWLGVVRASRPALLVSYPLLIAGTLPSTLASMLAQALPLVGSGALSGSHPPLFRALAAVTTLVLLAARVGVSRTARRLAGVEVAWSAALLDVVLAELVLLTALGRALTRTTVTWRGTTLEVRRGAPLRRFEVERQNGEKDRGK